MWLRKTEVRYYLQEKYWLRKNLGVTNDSGRRPVATPYNNAAHLQAEILGAISRFSWLPWATNARWREAEGVRGAGR